jgi:hypothetical protein
VLSAAVGSGAVVSDSLGSDRSTGGGDGVTTWGALVGSLVGLCAGDASAGSLRRHALNAAAAISTTAIVSNQRPPRRLCDVTAPFARFGALPGREYG